MRRWPRRAEIAPAACASLHYRTRPHRRTLPKTVLAAHGALLCYIRFMNTRSIIAFLVGVTFYAIVPYLDPFVPGGEIFLILISGLIGGGSHRRSLASLVDGAYERAGRGARHGPAASVSERIRRGVVSVRYALRFRVPRLGSHGRGDVSGGRTRLGWFISRGTRFAIRPVSPLRRPQELARIGRQYVYSKGGHRLLDHPANYPSFPTKQSACARPPTIHH